MFPLSEQLDDVNQARVDTYQWASFEHDFHMAVQPSLYLIKGKQYFVYQGDPRDLSQIVKFAKSGHK